MFRKHLSHQRSNEPHQLDITPFLNLMVALVPFLLVTAVFSRVAILELNLPNAESETISEDKQIIEIIIRENVLQLSDGNKVVSSYKITPSGYDLAGLSKALASLKKKFPQKTDASILLERQIQYDHLVAVMDTLRGRQPEVTDDDEDEAERIILFPDISIGDAP